MCSKYLTCGLLTNNRSDARPIKLFLVGDPGCGKTKLVKQHMEKDYTQRLEDDCLELYNSTFEEAGRQIPIVIYDAPAGQHGQNSHKNMYSNTDIILLCFDVCDKKTLESITKRWIPELQSAGGAKDYQFLLVGLKSDDRERHTKRDSRIGKESVTVSKEDGNSMHKLIKSCGYLECSAKTGEGVDKVFSLASLLALGSNRKAWFIKYVDWDPIKTKVLTTKL